MPEAVTVPSLMMMTSIVCEEVLVRGRYTDKHSKGHTQTQGSSTLKFAKLQNKKY